MASTRSYSIKKNRIKKACLNNIELLEDGRLLCEEKSGTHNLFLGYLDGGAEGCQWGRFHFDGQFADNVVVITRVAAYEEREIQYQGNTVLINEFLMDANNAAVDKKHLFEQLQSAKFVNQTDMLLYQIEGRYLWIYLEVLGMGAASISEMQVNVEGDNFMDTFPEIYQERNSFFHRYLSIFSSIYNDFQLDIDRLAKMLSIDTAPLQLLPVYAKWLGIEIDADILEEQELRQLLKEAYHLNKYKGTLYSIQKLIGIVIKEEVIIIEKNLMKDSIPYTDKETYEKLYGDSAYDVTILIKACENQSKRRKLTFLLEQFIPLRARVKIVFLEEKGMLNSYCYLDENAKIYEYGQGSLDHRQLLDGSKVLR